MVQDSSDVNKTVNLGKGRSDANKTVNIGNDTITLDGGDQADVVNTTETFSSHVENFVEVCQEKDLKHENVDKEPLAPELEVIYRNIDEIPFEKTEIPIKEKIAQLQDLLEKSMTEAETLPVTSVEEMEDHQEPLVEKDEVSNLWPVEEIEATASPMTTVEDPQISSVSQEIFSILESTIENQSKALNKSEIAFDLTVEEKPAESTLNKTLDIASPNSSDINEVYNQDTTLKASPVIKESPVENLTEKLSQSSITKNNSDEDRLDAPTTTVAKELSTPETVKVNENKQMSERIAQNITLPSINTNNNTFFDTMESRFDVEFKMPAVPVFKSQSDVSKDEEFKTCGSSCKKTIIRLTSCTCVRRQKVHFNTRKNLTAYNINKSCWCMCVGCVVTE